MNILKKIFSLFAVKIGNRHGSNGGDGCSYGGGDGDCRGWGHGMTSITHTLLD